MRLDLDVIDRFRADGPGWQGRVNAVLRKAAGL
ncbi:BrnA antitoxin family protein [Sphingomonas sp. PvP055]